MAANNVAPTFVDMNRQVLEICLLNPTIDRPLISLVVYQTMMNYMQVHLLT